MMDSSSHGPGGDDAKAPKRPPATEALVNLDEVGKKEAVQTKPQQQQKPALKKPDKLAPCPRCDSLDTKFCYYNNYNVNQPRHFCKNCQRYWTAGGTLRNVPVGAGRRKNKHGSLQARHGVLPEPPVAVRLDSQQSRPCHAARSHQSVPDRISPPLASSSSDPTVGSSIPSSQEGGSSGAVTHASSMPTVEAARRHYIPGTIYSMLEFGHCHADFGHRFFTSVLFS